MAIRRADRSSLLWPAVLAWHHFRPTPLALAGPSSSAKPASQPVTHHPGPAPTPFDTLRLRADPFGRRQPEWRSGSASDS